MYCLYCGKEIIRPACKRGLKPKYCNDTCRYDYHKNIKRKKTHRQEWEDCKVCGKEIHGHKRKMCSPKCRRINRYRSQFDEWPRRRYCKRCGTMFRISTVRGEFKYCLSCKILYRKAHNIRYKISRKHKLKDTQHQTIIAIDQFIKDGWQCQMCGIEVTLLSPFTRDNYANLDHIIPLIKGGPHILSNVQTLCRKCNAKKANKMPDEILEQTMTHKGVQIATA